MIYPTGAIRMVLFLFLTTLVLGTAGCSSSDATSLAIGGPPPPAQVVPPPQELSVGSKEVGELGIAQMRTARAISGAALIAELLRPGAQPGPAGPFTVELENQAGGNLLVRVREPRTGTVRGVLVAQPPIQNPDQTTTVNATLGDGQQGFFGCTGRVIYTLDPTGLVSLQFQQFLAQNRPGEYDADLLPPAIGGTLTRNAEGALAGRLDVPGREAIAPRGFFEDLGGWFVDVVVTPLANTFGFGTDDGAQTGSATVDPSFNTVGSATDIRPSGDLQSTGFFGSPAGVGQITGVSSIVANNGSRFLPGANIIGENSSGVIGQNGGNVIGQNGGNVIGQNGGNVIGQNGANLIPDFGVIGQNGGNVIGQNGGNVIGQNGGNVIGQNGANVIGQNGANIVANNGSRFQLVSLGDVDNDAPSSLGTTAFPAQPEIALQLMSNLTADLVASNLQTRTGTTLIFSVRAVDGSGNAVPYNTAGAWACSSQSSSPVLFMDPNNPGRYVAVNPGGSLVSFVDLQADLVAQSQVSVTGSPVVVPGTIRFATEPAGTQATFTALDPAPVVQVRDTNGNPDAGETVILEAIGPGAGFISAKVVTDGQGMARFPNFLLGSPGRFILVARTGSLSVIGTPFEVVSGRTLSSITVQSADGQTSLLVFDTLQLSARGTLDDASVVDVTNLVDWNSLNANASVTSTGLVRGLAAGGASIEVLQKGGGVSGTLALQVNPLPVTRKGILYIAERGIQGAPNGEILVGEFDPSSGALVKNDQHLLHTSVPLTAIDGFAAAKPSDLLLNSDNTRLIVGTDNQARVYQVSPLDGSLLLLSPGGSVNNFPFLRRLIQSGFGGVTNRFYGVFGLGADQVGQFRLSDDGLLTLENTFVMPGPALSLASRQFGSTDFLYVSLSNELRVINITTGQITAIALPPNLQFTGDGLGITRPQGTVLSACAFLFGGPTPAPVLATVPVDSTTGLPNGNQFTIAATIDNPRALVTDRRNDLIYVGSFNANFLDAFSSARFPTAPSRLANAPYATTGSPIAIAIGGVSDHLVFSLTSPARTLDVFEQALDFSLTQVDTSPVGAGNVQDLETTVIGNQ